MRRGDRDADSVASGDSKRESWGMGRGVTPIGEAASGRNARGDAVSESAASASSTGSWMRKGTRRGNASSAVDSLRSNAFWPKGAPRFVSRIALGRHNLPIGSGPIFCAHVRFRISVARARRAEKTDPTALARRTS
jgi:hypothetical protein